MRLAKATEEREQMRDFNPILRNLAVETKVKFFDEWVREFPNFNPILRNLAVETELTPLVTWCIENYFNPILRNLAVETGYRLSESGDTVWISILYLGI